MFKKTILAAAIAGFAALGASGAAEAHATGYKHQHDGKGTMQKRKKLQKQVTKNVYKHRNNNFAYKNRGRKRLNRRPARKGWFGPNAGGIPPYVIRQTLLARGYYKIAFTDRTLPLYVAKACRNGRRFAIGLNRWGKVMWKQPRGHCGPRFNLY